MARFRQLPRPSIQINSIDRIAPTAMVQSTSGRIIPSEIIERRPVLAPLVTFAPKLPKHIDRRRSQFEEMPYNLTEIVRAEDTEMYIAKSFAEHTQLIMREGFAIKSQDTEIEQYVNLRLKEIQILSGLSLKNIIRQAASDIVRTCNAYIVKSRVSAPTAGGSYRMNNIDLDPIVGLFVADPMTVAVLRDVRGRPRMYRQWIPATGSIRHWEPQDVIHLTYNQRTNAPYGTPWVMPSLDDVRLLRRFEEHVDILGGNFAQPFIVWKIGTDAFPMMVDPGSGESEVDKVKRELERLAAEGIAIVSHRHNPEALDTSSSGINLAPYLDYLKNRVTAGLGLNAITMGDGSTANRATATQLVQVGINRCKDIQEVMADQINSTLLFELQLDSGKRYNMAGEAYFEFAEIDVEAQQTRENHALAMFQGGAYTHPEMRREMNLNPMTDEEKDEDIIAWKERETRSELELEKELQLDPQIAAQVQVAKMKPTGSSTSRSTGTSNGSKKATANRNQPTNQSGTKSTKTKIRKNDTEGRLRLEENILTSTVLQDWTTENTSEMVSKTLKVYLDKVEDIADDFIRGSVKDHCSSQAVKSPDDKEINVIVQSAIDRYMNGNLSELIQKLDTDTCKNREHVVDLIREVSREVGSSMSKISNQLDWELSELTDKEQIADVIS